MEYERLIGYIKLVATVQEWKKILRARRLLLLSRVDSESANEDDISEIDFIDAILEVREKNEKTRS